MNPIECTNLVKRYGSVEALQDITFTLEENKITGLVGPNGAGKTTLLKLIAGFLRPTQGSIRIYGQAPFNNLTVSANLIFIDEHPPIPLFMSIGDVLATARTFYPNWNRSLATGLFKYFKLNPSQSFNNLSKGKKSIFAAIIGLASRCPLTIFDEPANGMDAAVRRDFYRALLKDYLLHPRTILMSSHHLKEIEDVLEDLVLVKNGLVVFHKPVAELKEYAVGIRGKSGIISHLINQRQVIHQENFGKDSSFIVVQNSRPDSLRQQAKQHGAELVPISASDLCIYLTSDNEGGIDDVFSTC